jgi:pimeloyl-ACP methyl ester carboxylesterase
LSPDPDDTLALPEPLQEVEKHKIALPDNGGTICCHYLPGGGPGFLVAGGYGLRGPMDKLLGITSLIFAKGRGQRCVIIDYLGQGESSGDRWSMTIPSMRADILRVADHYGMSDCIGVGASLGAWAMLSAQQHRPGLLRGMLALAPAFDWDQTYFAPRLADGRLQILADGRLGEHGMGFRISKELLDTAPDNRLQPKRIHLPGGLLVLHGTVDALADVDYAATILAELGETNATALRRLAGQGHGLSTLNDQQAQMEFIQICDRLMAQCGLGPASAKLPTRD